MEYAAETNSLARLVPILPHPSNLPFSPPPPTPQSVAPSPRSPLQRAQPASQYTPHPPTNSDRSQSHFAYPHSPGTDQSPTQAQSDCPTGTRSTPAVSP